MRQTKYSFFPTDIKLLQTDRKQAQLRTSDTSTPVVTEGLPNVITAPGTPLYHLEISTILKYHILQQNNKHSLTQ